MYESSRGKHVINRLQESLYPPGDRSFYMTCKNCGAMIWGYFAIEEDPI